MSELIVKGGFFVWLLLGCFALSFAIFLERFSYFHRATMNVGEFVAGLASLLRRKNYAEALQECIGTRVPAGRVLHAALLRHEAPREQLKEIVQEAGQLEVPRLERNLTLLYGIAHVAPLIGLLGTLIGLMDTFTQIHQVNGFANPTIISQGVFSSLISASLGLVVAIPSFLFYVFLSGKSRHLMNDLERAGIEILHIIEDHREPETFPRPSAHIMEFRQPNAPEHQSSVSSPEASGKKAKV